MNEIVKLLVSVYPITLPFASDTISGIHVIERKKKYFLFLNGIVQMKQTKNNN